jgi:hypothetical protein
MAVGSYGLSVERLNEGLAGDTRGGIRDRVKDELGWRIDRCLIS